MKTINIWIVICGIGIVLCLLIGVLAAILIARDLFTPGGTGAPLDVRMLWCPGSAIGFVIFLIVLLFHMRAYSKVWRPRQCADCGYDLTGNTSGVCPECGAER